MDVSIIIVNYNTKDILCDCINSIYEKTQNINFEIIISDNGSTDGSIDMIKSTFPNVILIENNANLGFGAANNKAVNIATGKNIFFLNSDTILINNAVKILSDFVDNNPKVGLCGGNLYDRREKPTASFIRFFPGVFYELNIISMSVLSFLIYGKNLHFNYTKHPLSVAWPKGADIMVSREKLKKYGAFDEKFFMYYEDTELGYRFRKNKLKNVCIPEAKIIHLEGKSNTINEKKARWMLSSRKIFLDYRYKFKFVKRLCDMLYKMGCKSMILKLTILGRTNETPYYKYLVRNFNELQS